MEPISWGAAIGGIMTIIAAIIGFIKHKRVTRDKLAQAEVDELKRGMDAVDATDSLREQPKNRT